MAVHQAIVVRNRLLTALSRDDFDLLMPMFERVPLVLGDVLIAANQPITRVVFPESGLVSTVSDTEEGRIEVGLIGREGMTGVPVILGTNRTPHTYLIQGAGEGLQIGTEELRDAIGRRPSIFRPLGLFAQALIVQMAQTIYATAVFTIEARLARWILIAHDWTDGGELQLTHEFLSTMLSVRRPGVTTALHVLEGMGTIRNRRGRIDVLDRAKLLDLAGDAYKVSKDEYERLLAEV